LVKDSTLFTPTFLLMKPSRFLLFCGLACGAVIHAADRLDILMIAIKPDDRTILANDPAIPEITR